MTWPTHARRCDWPHERCRIGRWRPVIPDHPTCYWGWPPALWSSSLYCCTPPSSQASRCWPSEDLSAYCCLYSANTHKLSCSIDIIQTIIEAVVLFSEHLHHFWFLVLLHHLQFTMMLINTCVNVYETDQPCVSYRQNEVKERLQSGCLSWWILLNLTNEMQKRFIKQMRQDTCPALWKSTMI